MLRLLLATVFANLVFPIKYSQTRGQGGGHWPQSDWKSGLFSSHLVACHPLCKLFKVSEFEIV